LAADGACGAALDFRAAEGHVAQVAQQEPPQERLAQAGEELDRLRRREFLGSDEPFKKIDLDGDRLISVEEAIRADALFRKEK
jgi:hypothetical protein